MSDIPATEAGRLPTRGQVIGALIRDGWTSMASEAVVQAIEAEARADLAARIEARVTNMRWGDEMTRLDEELAQYNRVLAAVIAAIREEAERE